MKKSLENTSNILDIRVTTTRKSTENEPRLEKNVVLALAARFSHLQRDVIAPPLALTMRCKSGQLESEEEDSSVGSEGAGDDEAGEEEESQEEEEDQEEIEEEEGMRELAKNPKKRPGVEMPSGARERIFRKRQTNV